MVGLGGGHTPLVSSLAILTRVILGLLTYVSHASLDVIVTAASEVGLASKLTGAGGGGCAIVLLPPSGLSRQNEREDNDAQIAVLKQLLNQKGFTSIETNLAESGIRLEYVQNTQR